MTQVFNPYLPAWEYIPDGEPHLFEGRLSVYGSHDRFNGEAFCMNDYVCWSADPTDLTEWTNHGVIYRKDQDPRNGPDTGGTMPDGSHAMWAPDVARGHDGRYYLYYCLDNLREIAVAVADEPAGAYEFLGFVRHPDGTLLGQRDGDIRQFDPGVLVDDDGRIWLYSGQGPLPLRPGRHQGRSEVSELDPDMLTLRTEPVACVPTAETGAGTGFEGHEFFEGSSIRKINSTYYFVYSSINMHELCYATSERPDGPYTYGGPIVSNGNIGLDGRTQRTDSCFPIGNTHGGIELVNGQWYVFYHRHTNRHAYSRQAMAEPFEIAADGSIAQVPMTSRGLNGAPLAGRGTYGAWIGCHLTGPRGGLISDPAESTDEDPYVTQDGGDREEGETPYVTNLRDGATLGFSSFDLADPVWLSVTTRGSGEGRFEVQYALDGPVVGEVSVETAGQWTDSESAHLATPPSVDPARGTDLFLTWRGTGHVDLIDVTLA